MAYSVTPFGTTKDGQPVSRCTLSGTDCEVSVLTWGATLQSVVVSGNNGPVDVLIGCPDMPSYEAQTCYIGSFVGRVANRISGGGFTLNGTRYELYHNDGPNTLHGGHIGYDKRIFALKEINDQHLVLTLDSPDGEEGFPGHVSLTVEYSLVPGGFALDWYASSDAETPFAPTNHAYWNLSGKGTVCDHELSVFADGFTPIDKTMAPLGEVLPVEGTPFDFRTVKTIGQDIGADHPQLILANGYDHNYAIKGSTGTLRPAAKLYSPVTGVEMALATTLPGVQLYTGNYLNVENAKGNVTVGKNEGVALEPQYFPDFVNCPAFEAGMLRPGEDQHHRTEWTFAQR